MGYVHLHCRSAYSLFTGTATPQALVAGARKLHMPALALTDRGNLYGAVPFYIHAQKAGVKAVIGMEVDLSDGSSLVLLARNMDGYRNLCHLSSVLQLEAEPEAFSPAGFYNEEGEDGVEEEILPWDPGMWGVPTFGFTPPAPASKRSASSGLYSGVGRSEVRLPIRSGRLPSGLLLSGRHARGLIALSGGPRGAVNKLVVQSKMQQAARTAGMLLSAFGQGNFFIELVAHDEAHRRAIPELASLAADLDIPIVASNDVLYLEQADAPVAHALASAQSRLRSKGGRGNGSRKEELWAPYDDRRKETSADDAYFKSTEEMEALFKDYPQALANTGYIAEQCNVELPLHKPLFPGVDLKEGETAYSHLWKLCFAGASRHYRPLNDAVISRLKHELETIEQLGFSPYFLVVNDIACFAKRRGIPIMARGSAANSLVAYVLDITQVDPLAHDLLFERFLNPERAEFELPDIDLDLCWRRRDEVLHYVYKRYGKEHVAIVGTHITFRLRSAWREMAKALGVHPSRISYVATRIADLARGEDEDESEGGDVTLSPEDDEYRDGGSDDASSLIGNERESITRTRTLRDEREREAFALAEKIRGLPRHTGMHCAGVVISPTEYPLADLVPLQRAARDPTMAITQYDKDAIESLGLVKMDLLGSRALTTLVDALQSSGLAGSAYGARAGGRGNSDNGNGKVRATGHRGSALQVAFSRIPFDDKRTYRMMLQGETVGCFQLESPGMRGLLKWLRPQSMADVAAAISLFRPGPMEAGFMETFMRCRLGAQPVTYPHPSMEPILRETSGVILYQEQFLRLAHELAGLGLGEAEKLRKALGKTRAGEERTRLGSRFVAGAIEQGIDQLQAEKVWEVVSGYTGFGFCKAHACSYALTAYRSAYMKAHYPAHFMAAQINNGGGFYGPQVYVEEARRLGIKVLPPHVNWSGTMCEVVGVGTQSYPNEEAFSNGHGHTHTRRNHVPSIRVGLQFIKGLSERTIALIIAERRGNGPFRQLQELLLRVEMTHMEAASLVKVGACDTLGDESYTSLWPVASQVLEGSNVDLGTESHRHNREAGVRPSLNRKQMVCLLPSLITTRRSASKARNGAHLWLRTPYPHSAQGAQAGATNGKSDPVPTWPLQVVMGDLLPGNLVSPRVLGEGSGRGNAGAALRHDAPPLDDYTSSEKLRLEQEVMGFSVSRNIMELYEEAARAHGAILSEGLSDHANRNASVAGMVVAGRRHQATGGDPMLFMTLQDTGGLVEVVLFPEVYRRHAEVLAKNGAGPYLVTGQVQVEGKGRGVGVQPPAGLSAGVRTTPADAVALKTHPIMVATRVEALAALYDPRTHATNLSEDGSGK